MSRWRPEGWAGRRAHRLVIGLDAQGAAWQAPADASARTAEAGALAAALAPQRLAGVLLVASADLAVHWVQPPAATASLAELRQVAQARCAELFGGSPAAWRVAGDWHPRRPFACAALPEPWASDIERSLAPLGVPVRWQTLWGLLAQRAPQRFPANGWCVLRSPRRLLVWQCRAGRPQSLAALPALPGTRAEVLAAQAWCHARLEAARHPGEEATGDLHWLDLCGSQAPLAEGIVPVAADTLPAFEPTSEAQAAWALARHLGEAGA